MEDELINDLSIMLMPHTDMNIQDLKMQIEIILQPYEVTKAHTELTVYQGDINERILKKFLAAKIAAGCSTRTVEYYGQSIKQTLETIGKPYADVTADDIRLYLAVRIHKDGVKKTTADNERRNLSSFYTWLQKEEILLKNPMNKVESIRTTKKKKKAYSLLDLEKIRLGCRNAREKAIVEFFASTWCRVSELLQVKISDIQGNSVEVHGKGDKYRTVYLNARAELAIKQYLQERHDENPYLFPGCACKANEKQFKDEVRRYKLKKHEWYKIPELISDTKIPDVSIIENTVRQIGKRAGVDNVHPHRFRRTGATMALRQGMPILQVSKLLGHNSLETTQIYLDISDEELQQAHDKYVI